MAGWTRHPLNTVNHPFFQLIDVWGLMPIGRPHRVAPTFVIANEVKQSGKCLNFRIVSGKPL
jgi:hypothetical protein